MVWVLIWKLRQVINSRKHHHILIKIVFSLALITSLHWVSIVKNLTLTPIWIEVILLLLLLLIEKRIINFGVLTLNTGGIIRKQFFSSKGGRRLSCKFTGLALDLRQIPSSNDIKCPLALVLWVWPCHRRKCLIRI